MNAGKYQTPAPFHCYLRIEWQVAIHHRRIARESPPTLTLPPGKVQLGHNSTATLVMRPLGQSLIECGRTIGGAVRFVRIIAGLFIVSIIPTASGQGVTIMQLRDFLL